MNGKTILIFLLGAFVSGLVFAGITFFSQKSAPVPTDVQMSNSIGPRKPVSIDSPTGGAMPASVPKSEETPLFVALLSLESDANSIFYVVKRGDNLTRIAKNNHVTAELLKKINPLSSDSLKPGSKLKIPVYKFSLVVDKSQNTMILKGGEEVLKTYVVATGQNNCTPVGVFKVTDKLVKPTWYKAGAVVPYGSPQNVLGTRWIGLSKKGYGIHGTPEPEKLGRQITAGCVRMRNDEVEELFGFVLPGTEVTIVD